MVRAPAAKAGDPGFDSRQLPWVFLLPAGLLVLMVCRICGAHTVQLLSTYMCMEGSVVL